MLSNFFFFLKKTYFKYLLKKCILKIKLITQNFLKRWKKNIDINLFYKN